MVNLMPSIKGCTPTQHELSTSLATFGNARSLFNLPPAGISSQDFAVIGDVVTNSIQLNERSVVSKCTGIHAHVMLRTPRERKECLKQEAAQAIDAGGNRPSV